MYSFNSPEFITTLTMLPETILESALELDPSLDRALLEEAIKELLDGTFNPEVRCD